MSDPNIELMAVLGKETPLTEAAVTAINDFTRAQLSEDGTMHTFMFGPRLRRVARNEELRLLRRRQQSPRERWREDYRAARRRGLRDPVLVRSHQEELADYNAGDKQVIMDVLGCIDAAARRNGH